MTRQAFLFTFLAVFALPVASPLEAQNTGVAYVPPAIGETIYTPEIHLGSATEPSTITVPPVEELIPNAPEAPVSNVPPASTALLATRHFDYIVSPLEIVPGSMEDTSFSLGDYARQLRAEKKKSMAPNAIANPANSR